MVKTEKLEGADDSLVYFVPFCREHGAMNKVSAAGYWRCISSYKAVQKTKGNPEPQIMNACRAGIILLDENPYENP